MACTTQARCPSHFALIHWVLHQEPSPDLLTGLPHILPQCDSSVSGPPLHLNHLTMPDG